MNKIKLKPCPFCGGRAKLMQIKKEPFAAVICRVCEVQSNIFSRAEDAVEAWNRRAGQGDNADGI